MKKRGLPIVVLSLALLAGAEQAGAATEVGNKCVADETGANAIAVGLGNAPGDPLPATIPSAGVVTRWALSVVPIPAEVNLTETLRILRPTGISKQFQVVGESAPVPVVGGTSTHATRIPVQAGDHIGSAVAAGGETGFLVCAAGGGTAGLIPGNPLTGSSGTVAEEKAGVGVPIVVFVEPDADGDGYGDETQDLCPQSAAFQTACPVVVLDAFAINEGKAVTVLVATSTVAPVKITAAAKLGKGANVKLSTKAKTVTPGRIARFRLTLPGSLRKKLKKLKPNKKLTLKIVASATDIAGRVTKDRVKARLKGQG